MSPSLWFCQALANSRLAKSQRSLQDGDQVLSAVPLSPMVAGFQTSSECHPTPWYHPGTTPWEALQTLLIKPCEWEERCEHP